MHETQTSVPTERSQTLKRHKSRRFSARERPTTGTSRGRKQGGGGQASGSGTECDCSAGPGVPTGENTVLTG